MSPFIWSLKVSGHLFQETLIAGRSLSAEATASLPAAAYVLVTTRLGVQLLDEKGEALDLEDVPYELAAKLAAFFGPGCYDLQHLKVERAYEPRSMKGS